METTRDRIAKIRMKYQHIISMDDAYDALWFAAHVLDNEADFLKRDEPYAVNTIRRFREGAIALRSLASEI